jgi:hypothetical protein
MSPQTKLALRRFALRWLRKLFDWLEDRLHDAEVKLRNDLSGPLDRQHPSSTVPSSEDMLHQRNGRTTKGPESETHKPKSLRRKHVTASAFDLRFSSR